MRSNTPENRALLHTLAATLREDPVWSRLLSMHAQSLRPHVTLHLAVFTEPYLADVLAGRKTIESRFAVRRTAPYGQVREGDIVLLKEPSGPVVGLCRVGSVWFYRLAPSSWKEIQGRFGSALGSNDPFFLASKSGARYATLMELRQATTVGALHVAKRDRRGWVVLGSRPAQASLLQ
jgi:hypothetical protein